MVLFNPTLQVNWLQLTMHSKARGGLRHLSRGQANNHEFQHNTNLFVGGSGENKYEEKREETETFKLVLVEKNPHSLHCYSGHNLCCGMKLLGIGAPHSSASEQLTSCPWRSITSRPSLSPRRLAGHYGPISGPCP